MHEALSFDDVLLVPKQGVLDSRKDADISGEIVPGWRIDVPILSANMPSVTGPDMVLAMEQVGAFGILPRFNTTDEAKTEARWVARKGTALPIVSVGLQDQERVSALWDYTNTFCVDVAHGDHERVVTWIKSLTDWGMRIIVGNVATYEGALRLIDSGASALKVGIGPGAACTTREVTGFGVPQLTAIMEVSEAIGQSGADVRLIADGGIKNSGDIVKALAAGADTVMVGRLLAGTNESPKPGVYYGNASQFVRDYRAPEGIHGEVELTGWVEDVIKSLAWGIRSGLSYGGARNVRELQANAEFVRVSHSTSIESGTRI